MTTDEIISKLNEILSKQFGKTPEEINPNKSLSDDLGADSLDVMEIITDTEYKFGITIEDGEYEHCNTVQDIINLIEKKLKDK
ncbi:AcpP Acyl carrier protein [uncultured Caudovirales phage]|uniref:AcpP Acyl carrier protein n=1 Tax=uncultured Caudovirales phage TaxID=2100421 RepID=A0A6J5LFS1_9CAUD|nr:AcpP Acyl carrier protein [uncultured Caudovirales phage]